MHCSCCDFEGDRRNIESPFGRLIAIDYYDGPLCGLIECRTCKALFCFEAIDCDEGQDTRVFSLARVLQYSIDTIPNIESLQPHWPTWQLIGKANADAAKVIDTIARTAMPPHCVVVTTNLLSELLVWHWSDSIANTDWFGVLRLKRRSRK